MQEQFLKLLNKTINDEVSAAIFYKRAAQELTGPEIKPIADELTTHADEEMGHFDMLIGYASNYDLLSKMNIMLDASVANFQITTVEAVIAKVQELEAIAIDDYEQLFSIAHQMKDFSGIELFRKILEDEIEHYDDLAYVLGQKRDLFQTDPDANNGMEDGVVDGPEDTLTNPKTLVENSLHKSAASVLAKNKLR